MKIILVIIVLTVAALFLLSGGDGEVFKRNAEQLKMEKYFISNKEPKVKDALWTSDNMFKVAVFNDGQDRNGYAKYVCEVLSEAGFKDKRVQVIDVIKLNKEGKWVLLGSATCKDR